MYGIILTKGTPIQLLPNYYPTIEKSMSKVLLNFIYFKRSGKYYSDGSGYFDPEDEIFQGCYYPSDICKKINEAKLLPGLASGTWNNGHILINSDEKFGKVHLYPELVITYPKESGDERQFLKELTKLRNHSLN